MGGGRDVSWDLAINIYHSYLTRPFIWKEYFPGRFLSRQNGVPVRSTGIPEKAGQFLSCKHSVPLCRDDIMLTLQIVLGEIVPGRNILM